MQPTTIELVVETYFLFSTAYIFTPDNKDDIDQPLNSQTDWVIQSECQISS